MKAEIFSERFIIRSLNPRVDDLTNYLSWMRDESSNPFIQGVNKNFLSQDLIEYVSAKNESTTALLLGIFAQPKKTHIGNIKLEPIIPMESATIGILVGEEDWRGRGVGFEVVTRVLEYCFKDLKLETIELGVDSKNISAIKLYRRLGFVENTQEPYSSNSMRMSISKSSL